MSGIEGLRLILGFVIAPAVGALGPSLVMGAMCAFEPRLDGHNCFDWIGAIGMAGLYIGYFATCVLGLPLFILFGIRGGLKLWQVVLGGSLVALCLGGIFTYPDPLMNPKIWLISIVDALLTTIAFWLIAIFRNRSLTSGSRQTRLQQSAAEPER